MKHHLDVEAYLAESERWPDEIRALRPILTGCGLTEQIKWGKPCYSHDGANIAIIQEMNDYLALMFFKGALLSDPAGILHDQGPNSRSARRLQFTSAEQIEGLAGTIRAYVAEATDIEEAGVEIGPAPELVLVKELQDRLDENPALERAFRELTPGRQREYNLYFSSAKQASTRASRIDKYAEKILTGKGLRDR